MLRLAACRLQMSEAVLRRTVLIGLVTTAAGTALAQPNLRPVRLLVVRRPAAIPSSNCAASCIRGKLFDISDITGALVPAAIVALGRTEICDVIERPWKDNAPSVSSIPKGIYAAKIRTDSSKTWMVGKPDRAWRLELQIVPGDRSNIQFHYGLDESWSEGCFIVGKPQPRSFQTIDASYCQLTDGESSVAAIRKAVTKPGADSSKIEITVADQDDIFTNLPTRC